LEEEVKDCRMRISLEESSRPGDYAEAFRRYGIDVEALPAEEAARRISSRKIRPELVGALDLWAVEAGPGRQRWQLLEGTGLADPAPGREQMRTALGKGARRALEEMAASVRVDRHPPADLVLLGVALARAGATAPAVALLRRGLQSHRNDFWINYRLAV